ncbi:MAG TPA: TIGR03790 family protein [Planctomycetota bacterium]|nr:TIGR03790 family protein [Planctomycetota bacterium]
MAPRRSSRPIAAGALLSIAAGALPSIAAGALLVIVAGLASADILPNQVLVVVNDASPTSVAIGQYYASVRPIPAVNVFHLPPGTPTSEIVTRGDYNALIRDPIRQYLEVTQPALKTQVKCILLTKGVPHGVAHTNGSGLFDDAASVDSELTQLFTGKVPDVGQPGHINNPFYNSQVGIEQFTSTSLSYLVCRLDGYGEPLDPTTGVPVDIKNLIDRAQTPATGAYVLDGDPTKTGGYAIGETWMTNATTKLLAAGLAVVHDVTTSFLADQPAILGYASWGSNDAFAFPPPYYGTIGASTVPGTFLPGSLATDYVSTSARSFQVGTPYGQSLIADLIKMGCTAANGHVFEPFLNACSQPDKLFPNYARGLTVAEAYYTSISWLSWMNVVVCDPLMKRMQVVSQIQGVTPSSGVQGGGTAIQVFGLNFSTLLDTHVTIGGVAATPTSVSAISVFVPTPPHAPGPVDIVVTNSSGTFVAPVQFQYAPSISSAQPLAIGTSWSFLVVGMNLDDAWALLVGSPAPPLPIPPLGDLLLDLASPITDVASGDFGPFVKQQSAALAVPNDPNLVGLSLGMQAIVGGGDGVTYLLSNRLDMTIQ